MNGELQTCHLFMKPLTLFSHVLLLHDISHDLKIENQAHDDYFSQHLEHLTKTVVGQVHTNLSNIM